jgi:hypothetical protein
MAKEITFSRKVEMDGAAIRLYVAKGGAVDAESEYVAIYLEAGNVESKVTAYDFASLKALRDACDAALKEMNDESAT